MMVEREGTKTAADVSADMGARFEILMGLHHRRVGGGHRRLVLPGVSSEASQTLVLSDGAVVARFVPQGEALARRPLVAATPVVELFTRVGARTRHEQNYMLSKWYAVERVLSRPFSVRPVLAVKEERTVLTDWLQVCLCRDADDL